jgi:hypothetical protein
MAAGALGRFSWTGLGLDGARQVPPFPATDDFVADNDPISRFEPVLDPCGTWFVFDHLHGNPAEIGRRALVGMSRGDAFLLATMLEGGRPDIEPDSTTPERVEVERDNYRSKLARVPVQPFRPGR